MIAILNCLLFELSPMNKLAVDIIYTWLSICSADYWLWVRGFAISSYGYFKWRYITPRRDVMYQVYFHSAFFLKTNLNLWCIYFRRPTVTFMQPYWWDVNILLLSLLMGYTMFDVYRFIGEWFPWKSPFVIIIYKPQQWACAREPRDTKFSHKWWRDIHYLELL